MKETINARITVAQKTEQEWLNSDVILLAGEMGVSSDTQVIKVGNGRDRWADLKSHQGERGERGLMGPRGLQGIQGPIGKVGPVGPKGDKGEPFKFNDLTSDQIQQIKSEALDLKIGGLNLLPTSRNLYSLNTYQHYKFQQESEDFILSVTDKDTDVDISGIFVCVTTQWSPNNAEKVQWIVRNGVEVNRTIKGNKELYFSIYPNNTSTFEKVFNRYHIKIERGNMPTM